MTLSISRDLLNPTCPPVITAYAYGIQGCGRSGGWAFKVENDGADYGGTGSEQDGDSLLYEMLAIGQVLEHVPAKRQIVIYTTHDFEKVTDYDYEELGDWPEWVGVITSMFSWLGHHDRISWRLVDPERAGPKYRDVMARAEKALGYADEDEYQELRGRLQRLEKSRAERLRTAEERKPMS
jgi:hypothetical protein